jgi:uncharacterized membrane protein YqhA
MEIVQKTLLSIISSVRGINLLKEFIDIQSVPKKHLPALFH